MDGVSSSPTEAALLNTDVLSRSDFRDFLCEDLVAGWLCAVETAGVMSEASEPGTQGNINFQ